jgi:predicted Zn-dependent peptidase
MKEDYKEVQINKAKIALYQMSSVSAATIYLLIKAGSRYEKGPQWGAHHLLEHMSFLGSKRFITELDTEIFKETYGIKSNAFTGSETLGFWIKFPSKSQSQALELLNEYIFESLIPQKLITKEVSIITQEYIDKFSNPYARFNKESSKVFWGKNHIYIRDGIGQPEYVKTIKRNDLLQIKSRFFQPKNMSIAVAGNFDSDKISISLTKILSNKKNTSKINRIIPKSNTKNYYYWHKEDVDQVVVCLSYKTLGYENLSLREQLAFNIGSYIIGGSTRSIMFQKIRMQKGLAYRTGARLSFFAYEGEFELSSSVNLKNAQTVARLMHSLLKNFITHKIDNTIFTRSKNYILTSMMMSFDSVENIASNYSRSLYYENRIVTLKEYQQIINTINEKEVRDLISKFVHTKKIYINILSKTDPQLSLTL